MMVETISESLRTGRKICFAIARRQVVLELAQRLSEIFPSADIVPVCQGHTDQLTADLIVCTTHQLYRYSGSFDILILDEPDAFRTGEIRSFMVWPKVRAMGIRSF